MLSIVKRSALNILLGCVAAGLSGTAWATDNPHYAITLASSLTPFTAADRPSGRITKNLHVYVTRVTVNNRRWYRLNLGFFSSRSLANTFLKKLRKDERYQDAWIRGVPTDEYRSNIKRSNGKADGRAKKSAPAPTRKKPVKAREQVRWNGSFSQFSRREMLRYNDGTTQTINVLINNLGAEGHYQDKDVAVRTNFDSTYNYTVYDDHTIDNEWRLSSLHLAFNLKHSNTDLILGRQFANSGGVLGRFDGIWLGQRVSPRWRISIYAGYPVDLFGVLPIDETDRHFAGISFDMGRFANTWDFNLFAISQQINGIVDRQAIGGEIRFSNRKRSHLLLLDYDTSYNSVNTFVLSSNWVLPARFTFNLLLDSRTIPTLATSNALWGRPESGIDELLMIMTEDEIRQLARDRTTRGNTITVGLSRPIGNNYQLTTEFTRFDQTDMIASGGVAAIDYGGVQNIAKLTFIGSGMFKKGDLSIISLRHTSSDTISANSLDMNVRYPLTRAWRTGPTLYIERANNRASLDTLTIKPSLGIDYRWLNNITFDVSLSYVYINVTDPGGNDSRDTLFRLGYRYDF